MVHGRQGMRLEAWKFGVYLIIPISASLTFNDPQIQEWAADYFQFLKYPANPNTNLKGEFEELLQKKQVEKEQRRLYAEQVQKLHDSAQASRLELAARDAADEERRKLGWFSWLRFRRGNTSASSSQSQ
jgi:hypothetical protein